MVIVFSLYILLAYESFYKTLYFWVFGNMYPDEFYNHKYYSDKSFIEQFFCVSYDCVCKLSLNMTILLVVNHQIV